MIDVSTIGKPINTVLSAGSDIAIPALAESKSYLSKNYQNRYNLPPHLTYMLCPFPEYNLKTIVVDLDAYFLRQKPLKFHASRLIFEPEKKFFSIPLIGDEIKKIHTDFVTMFNSYRDGYVREKDLMRIQAGERSSHEIELIRQYGYFRILDAFTPHITIGNVEVDMNKVPAITKKLEGMLKDIIEKDITIDRVKVVFHTDSEIQSEMKEIFSKKYVLE